MKILVVLTSHDKLGNTGEKTGFWLEELAAPYYKVDNHRLILKVISLIFKQTPHAVLKMMLKLKTNWLTRLN